MKTRRIDTDGIFDRCYCGERVRLVLGDRFGVECECGEAEYADSLDVVMVIWNRKMREKQLFTKKDL